MTRELHQGLDLDVLQDYLPAVGIPVSGYLRAHLVSGGKSNLTYVIEDDNSKWILRRPPTAGLTPTAHDMAREYRITSALRHTDVPVAPTLCLCEDETVMGAPFTVVDYVDGHVIRTHSDLDLIDDRSVESFVAALIRVLGALHDVDYRSVGLEQLGRPDGYVTRQVALWAKQWDRVKTADSTDLDRLHTTLAEKIPKRSESSIVHGDYRIDNAILTADSRSIAAVVDWELSTLGDPLTDVALMCVYRNEAFDLVIGEPAAWTSSRLPTADQLAEQYARTSGRDLTNWGFYLALANFKLAVIAQGINHRYQLGATVGAGFDRAGESVPEFIAAGLHTLRASN